MKVKLIPPIVALKDHTSSLRPWDNATQTFAGFVDFVPHGIHQESVKKLRLHLASGRPVLTPTQKLMRAKNRETPSPTYVRYLENLWDGTELPEGLNAFSSNVEEPIQLFDIQLGEIFPEINTAISRNDFYFLENFWDWKMILFLTRRMKEETLKDLIKQLRILSKTGKVTDRDALIRKESEQYSFRFRLPLIPMCSFSNAKSFPTNELLKVIPASLVSHRVGESITELGKYLSNNLVVCITAGEVVYPTVALYSKTSPKRRIKPTESTRHPYANFYVSYDWLTLSHLRLKPLGEAFFPYYDLRTVQGQALIFPLRNLGVTKKKLYTLGQIIEWLQRSDLHISSRNWENLIFRLHPVGILEDKTTREKLISFFNSFSVRGLTSQK